MATQDDRLWKLHLRRSLGEALTEDEQSALDVWYEDHNQAEALALGLPAEVDELSSLKQQVHAILGRIVTTSQSIEALTSTSRLSSALG